MQPARNRPQVVVGDSGDDSFARVMDEFRPACRRCGITRYRGFASYCILAATHPAANFADSFTRTPLNYLPISKLTLSIDVGIGANQLTWASPPPLRSDELLWRSARQGIGQVKFIFHDLFVADRLSRESFIAGILISIAASAALLLLEKLIEWRIDRRKSEASNYLPTQISSTGGQASQPGPSS
jgi:hypothetical protein